ncbi:hypothetical protein [Streptomyces bacillaris]|uniref:hypothetical protein n=1 Tax=Streptomyces bacillaris TaxID=68179 RepID=UPI003460F8BA
MICVDCDRAILGPAVRAGVGESMSGARLDGYAHPPESEECQPKEHSKQALRKALRAQAAAGRR